MRISGGIALGIKLKSLPSLRPTTELVREAIFSMLDSFGWYKDKVLDLFAGTGALGIEALSRGAKWVDFVEYNPRHCKLIEENLKATSFYSQAKVYRISADKALLRFKGGYSLVFLDPPYNFAGLPQFLSYLSSSPLLLPNSLVVVSHSKRLILSPNYGNLKVIRERNYGDTVISIYRNEGSLRRDI